MVLFEEIGGNPSLVNFQTVSVGTACGNAYENHTLELSCQNRPISAINFASFGNPQGTCGSFVKGTCESNHEAWSIIEKVTHLLIFCTIFLDRKSTRLNSSHSGESRMPSSA